MALDQVLVDITRSHACCDDVADGAQELLPASVVEREGQHELVIVPCPRDCVLDRLPQFRRQRAEIADMAKLGALPVQLVGFGLDRAAEDVKDPLDLLLWPPPVLCRKCPECEIA